MKRAMLLMLAVLGFGGVAHGQSRMENDIHAIRRAEESRAYGSGGYNPGPGVDVGSAPLAPPTDYSSAFSDFAASRRAKHDREAAVEIARIQAEATRDAARIQAQGATPVYVRQSEPTPTGLRAVYLVDVPDQRIGSPMVDIASVRAFDHTRVFATFAKQQATPAWLALDCDTGKLSILLPSGKWAEPTQPVEAATLRPFICGLPVTASP